MYFKLFSAFLFKLFSRHKTIDQEPLKQHVNTKTLPRTGKWRMKYSEEFNHSTTQIIQYAGN
jgi:hypothetical protein